MVAPPQSLRLPDEVPYCSLLMTHAVGEKFKAVSLAERKASCIGIGIQGFNKDFLGQEVTKILEGIVSPDMSYFGKYDADIIKLAYSHMHPLTHWNLAMEQDLSVDECSSLSSDSEDPKDGVFML